MVHLPLHLCKESALIPSLSPVSHPRLTPRRRRLLAHLRGILANPTSYGTRGPLICWVASHPAPVGKARHYTTDLAAHLGVPERTARWQLAKLRKHPVWGRLFTQPMGSGGVY
jgi:hypothetical protein